MDKKKQVILTLAVAFLLFSFIQQYAFLTLTGMATEGSGTVGLCMTKAPSITSIDAQTATIGRLFSYQVNCTPDCDEALVFYYLLIPSLDSFTINTSTGAINFTPQSGEDGSYTAYVYCDKSGFDPDSESFALTVNTADRPASITGVLNTDNSSVNLNWSTVSGVDNYTIYYSSNISSIMNLSLDAIPADVSQMSNLTSTRWNDTNASDVQKRYYTVSAWKSGVESLTIDLPVGKFTYYYTTPPSDTYGKLASNRISLYLDASYTAENFLQEIPSYLNSTISRLDKTNASGEFFTTHVRGLADGNDFSMTATTGYQLTVDNYFNHTIVGKVYNSPYILSYDAPDSSTYGTLATNWRGIYDFNKTHTAETFLQQIPSGLNPTISRLDKTDASGEYLTTHVRGLADGNDFDMNLGVGYAITVDGYNNHTLCTGCFS